MVIWEFQINNFKTMKMVNQLWREFKYFLESSYYVY